MTLKKQNEENLTMNMIGKSINRKDTVAKAIGKACYASDIYKPGTLHAKIVMSTHAHALIKSIDTKDAMGSDGVIAVLTAKDIPGINAYGLARPDQQVLAEEKVRFIGEPLALVIAKDPESARKAISKVHVEYDPLPAVFDPIRALDPSAPKIHDSGNLILHTKVRRGNIESGLKDSYVVVENIFNISGQDHAPMEPANGIGWLETGDSLVICSPSQGVFRARKQIAYALNLPINQVRVICPTIGGGFGRKDDISVEILIGLAVLFTKRPVKMVYSRREEMLTQTHRHPVIARGRTGATKEGKLTFTEAVLYGDSGAYCSLGIYVIKRTAMHLGGPYYYPHYKADSFSVYTNNPISGAFRGFGIPQAALVHETLIDQLAQELRMDPLEFRLLNCIRPGQKSPTGQIMNSGCGIEATLLTLKEYRDSMKN